ncbi:c2h2 finger domain containing protein [Grosmannia clavigera kw1407]|uniref:C2h2 finger domain containing protein n=1 Tax=Grosmannia clavigera (strain kw1407 / UAMH 11150) TaxID=655863 RepID=F0XLV1_GROCL|nr:c2h2 finger domain containing protein [Grosmannia clavigera kw1407]EFX01491.1 c2h2 finger domain containing protein [Grosmannia clavigera kw1407]
MATIASGRPAMKLDAPASHPYSCNTCQVAFRNSDLQKNHMKGDWHRYNLKRRVTSLPPISSELFAERVIQSRASTAAEADRASFERVCEVCQKTYYSENSFRNHISSQKHKAKEVVAAIRGRGVRDGDEGSSVLSSTFSLGEPHQKAVDITSETVDSDAEEEFTQVVKNLKKATIEGEPSLLKRPEHPHLSAAAQHKDEHPLTQATATSASEDTATPALSKSGAPAHSLNLCLFCNYASPSVALNTAHMERFHGMFIPEKQYLVDTDGLLDLLQTRIRDDHECIYCGKIRADVFAVQTHMRDKAHCKIPYSTVEEQVEIGDFYGFRATYSDSEPDEESSEDEKELKTNGGAKLGTKLGARRATKTTVAGGDGSMSDDDEDDREGNGWETDSSASSLDSDDLTAVPADNHYHQFDRLERHPHHSQTDPRAHHQTDGWHSHAHKHNHAVFYDEYELHLPSGRSVGHRSLNRYFRQNLRNYPSLAEREKLGHFALEAGDEATDAGADVMELDEDAATSGEPSSALTRTNRAVSTRPPPRNTLGLAGVSDKSKAALVKVERKAVLSKTIATDKARIRHSAKSIGQSFRFLGRT